MTEWETIIEGLAAQQARLAPAAERVQAEHGDAILSYRNEIEAALRDAIQSLRTTVAEISGGNPFCDDLAARTGDYLEWFGWALGDLPYFAAAVRPSGEGWRQDLSGCILVYFGCRVLDDWIDRHFMYRGRETLLASLSEVCPHNGEAESLTVLLATLLYLHGLAQMDSQAARAGVLLSLRRVFVGVLMERSAAGTWSAEFYERLIRLKNVDYWRVLYTALDPAGESPLLPLLCDYYAVAQKLNDLQGHARDQAQGRPNLVAVCRGRIAAGQSAVREAALELGQGLLRLGRDAEQLQEPVRSIACAKIAEMQAEAERLGVFRESRPASSFGDADDLRFFSTAEDCVEYAGAGALEETACAVCGASDGQALFRKQGFLYQRCRQCAHIYVNPRPRAAIRHAADRLGPALDAPFEAARMHAAPLCRMFSHHAAGPRMLLAGSGLGALIREARAAGFQVYASTPSAAAAEDLAAFFGQRTHSAALEDWSTPWGFFDLIALHHLLDRVNDPGQVLRQAAEALNGDGLLYVSVADANAAQFRIFGKHWEAVNPMVGCHLFSEQPLLRLLAQNGFEPMSRLRMAPVAEDVEERWMRLFRKLGGDETGELGMLARRATPPA